MHRGRGGACKEVRALLGRDARLPELRCERIDPLADVQGCRFGPHGLDVRLPVGCPYGTLSLFHRFTSIVETGAAVADAAKLIAPASKTFAPAAVS